MEWINEDRGGRDRLQHNMVMIIFCSYYCSEPTCSPVRLQQIYETPLCVLITKISLQLKSLGYSAVGILQVILFKFQLSLRDDTNFFLWRHHRCT